ncbi:hypothetical protein D3C72_1862800 [compost metagenome]
MCRAKKRPSQGRSNWPSTSGNNNKAQRSSRVAPRSMPLLPVPTTRLTSQGVMKIPRTLDRLALRIAAGTLPPALPVRATEDEMVEGRAHR